MSADTATRTSNWSFPTAVRFGNGRIRELPAMVRELGASRPLIVTEDASENLFLSARNLPYVQVRDVQCLDPVALVGAEHVIMTAEAVKKVEEWLA